MSSRSKRVKYVPVLIPQGRSNCICSFTDLIKLILIILQFSNWGRVSNKRDIISNDILFIIAMYFLSCTGCGRENYTVHICDRCGGYYY